MSNEIAEIKKNDYVVAEDHGRSKLIRVLSNRDGVIKGKWEIKDQESDIEVDLDKVKANLGPDPQIGSVYGVKTERLLDVTDTKPIKIVEWYFNATDEAKQHVHEGILAGAKLLRKHQLHLLLKVVKARVTFNTAKKLAGKTVIGTYQCKGGTDDNPDVLTIKYHPEVVKIMPYLICHEAGHGIWARLMSPEYKAQWMVEFWKRSEVTEIEVEIVDEAIKMAVKERSIWLEDGDYQEALDSALSNIDTATGLRARDIHLLLQTDLPAAKAILKPWRTYPTFSGEREMLVTDYSKTNVEEFWCETLACYCSGQSVPDYIKELLEDTLAHVQNRDVYIPEAD